MTLHRYYFTDQGTRLIPAAWFEQTSKSRIPELDLRSGRQQSLLCRGDKLTSNLLP
jgi:hypothetical protein